LINDVFLHIEIFLEMYPFEHKEHKIYANTFLQNVLVEWHYASIVGILDQDSIKRFLEEKFKIKTEEDKNIQYPIIVSSKDKDIQLFFDRDVFKLNVRVNYYKGFESLNPFLRCGLDYLKLNDAQNIESCLIRKIDVFPFKNISSNNTSNATLLNKIFSKKLLEGISVSSNDAFQSFWSKNFEDRNNSENVVIKFGFQRKQVNDSDKGLDDRFVLDFSIDRIKNIPIDKINSNLSEMNKVLYDAFHWSVNQDIIDIMERGRL